jgi:shikimate kinase/3-dehydroquinate synthase
VGEALARALEVSFVDLDNRIAEISGIPISELFEAEGESGFRAREKNALEEIVKSPPGVVALGGGALLAPANHALANEAGTVICLTAAPETLYHRVQAADDTRPLIQKNDLTGFNQLLNHRNAHYQSFPRQIATDELTPPEVAWEIQLHLGQYHVRGMGIGYDILVTEGSIPQVGDYLRSHSFGGAIGLVSDERVFEKIGPIVEQSLAEADYLFGSTRFPAGEESKNIATLERVWESLLGLELERRSTLLALGGGVVSDIAGFAAATYMRGINWVSLPTSLLAMVDASIGGKTGVDLPQGKNLVGAFHPPRLVLIDPDVLSELPVAEFKSGLAEVVKHGVIGDPVLFELCASGIADIQREISVVVRRAVGVKVKVITADPYEQGLRASLNLGHTIGHAVESASEYRLRHGEAVAIGLVSETRLSEAIGMARSGLSDRIAQTLHGVGLPTEIPSDLDPARIIHRMMFDKKKVRGKPRFALPIEVGKVQVNIELDDRGERCLFDLVGVSKGTGA